MGVSGSGRERFLADASQILASSLDLQRTLSSVAALAVPNLGDWCVVDLLEQGEIERRALASVDGDPELESLMWHFAPDPDQPRGVSRVIHGGGSELIEEITDAQLVEAARGSEHLAYLRRLDPRSYLCVPMV